jgi:hypothetical protein
LGIRAKALPLGIVGFGSQKTPLEILEKIIRNFKLLTGVSAGGYRAGFEIDGKKVVLYIAGDLFFIVVVKRLFDLLKNGLVIHSQL